MRERVRACVYACAQCVRTVRDMRFAGSCGAPNELVGGHREPALHSAFELMLMLHALRQMSRHYVVHDSCIITFVGESRSAVSRTIHTTRQDT